jgi:hypothetical protein
MMDLSWSGFLALLSNPNGIAAAVGVVLSLVVEYIPTYEALAPKWKRLVFGGACFVVPLAAAGLGIATAGWDVSWEATFWPAVLAGGIAFGGGTVAHVRKL